MSDTYAGLKKAIKTVFQGASWQSCRVHFMRNVLTVVPKGSQNMVASTIRTIFTQPDREHSNKRLTEVVPTLGRSHFQVAIMLDEARHDFLAFDLSRVSLNGTVSGFSQRHWRQIWSGHPPERVDKETKRRTDVVAVFPNRAALLRLAGSVLIEQHNEWKPATTAISPHPRCSSSRP